jgi:hypothetical protein
MKTAAEILAGYGINLKSTVPVCLRAPRGALP